jgi:hypothetical protein
MRPNITVGHISKVPELKARLREIGKRGVYVGIPESSANERSENLLKIADKKVSQSFRINKKTGKLSKVSAKSRFKIEHFREVAKADVSNAQLLWIFSKGSPLRSQPARPVLEAAVVAEGNKEAIAAELAAATKAGLAGDQTAVTRYLKRAGLAGQNAARSWFTDSRNGWEPNAQYTIDQKGSARPGIDTGAMRAALTYVVDAKS